MRDPMKTIPSMKCLVGLLLCVATGASTLRIKEVETPCSIQFLERGELDAALIWDEQKGQVAFFDYTTGTLLAVIKAGEVRLCPGVTKAQYQSRLAEAIKLWHRQNPLPRPSRIEMGIV